MATDLAAQLDALNNLYHAYECAWADITTPVMRIAFGDPPPPLAQCTWPPTGINETEVNRRLGSVQHCLQDRREILPRIITEIRNSQVALGKSGFDVPRSYIIPKPLEDFKGGLLGLCGIAEILKSVAAEHSALEKVLREIDVDLQILKGKVAGAIGGGSTQRKGESIADPFLICERIASAIESLQRPLASGPK